jgi:ribosomal protein S18 acetylase RimI-like enzyme
LSIRIVLATPEDAVKVASLVTALTQEICEVMNDHTQFNHNVALIQQLCRSWIEENSYTVLLAYVDGENAPVGMAAIAQTHALYAEGKIGVIQECYVAPAYRNRAVGGALLDASFALAPQKEWVCMELCTPPLPEFARSLDFYQKHGFKPVGGRKMRRKNSLNLPIPCVTVQLTKS